MPAKVPKVDLKSKSITEEQKEKLRQLFPEVFTEEKIDWDKLQQTLGTNLEDGKERFGLTWRGKSGCFRIIQEPSIGTLKPAPGESVNWDTTENLFIEGDNLEILKLLQKSYYGKVKMIYIDPPYNTGKEFIYPDKYAESLDTYLAYTGQVDSEGKKFSTNTETGGRYHSNWLNMMYPRLFLARNLLMDDGIIFVSIDDNEVHNLREMMNEIFGEENFVANVIWEKKYSPQNDARWLSDNHDHILLFAKNKEIWRPRLLPRTEEADARYSNPDNDPRGVWKAADFSVRSYSRAYDYTITTPSGRKVNPPEGRCWAVGSKRYQEFADDNRIWFGKNGNNVPAIKIFLSEVKQGITSLTIWKREEVGDTEVARKLIKEIFGNSGIFETPKPVDLIKKMLNISTTLKEKAIVFDFFSGSCTTAHAVLELNKEDGGNLKFIMVQLPEPTGEDSEAFKAGYKTIADIGKERIRRVIKKINDERKEAAKQKKLASSGETSAGNEPQDLGFRVFKLDKSNFKVWDGRVPANGKVEKQLEDFIDHVRMDSTNEDILYELLLKSGFELTTPVSEKKIAGKKIYAVADSSLLICLERDLTKEFIVKMAETKPARAICLDSGFRENDQLRTNAMEIMRSHGVEDFRTV